MTKKKITPGETLEPRKGARSEPDRGGGGSPGARGHGPGGARDPEVLPRARRRRFSAAYKLRIVQQADRCTEPGEVGALLRREGLYSSHLTEWRRGRDQGQLDALASKRRGPKPDPDRAIKRRVTQLEHENARLRRKLETAETILEVQGNVSRLLGLTMPKSGSDS